jgi:hypothetical protein
LLLLQGLLDFVELREQRFYCSGVAVCVEDLIANLVDSYPLGQLFADVLGEEGQKIFYFYF